MESLNVAPGLAGLGAHLNADLRELDSGARLDLHIDDYPRVSLARGAGGRLELELPLGLLPLDDAGREALLDKLMLRVTAGAGRRRATLALSMDGEQVLLQAVIDEEDGVGSLELFLDDADYWTTQLAGEA